jgi:hypothetical protein
MTKPKLTHVERLLEKARKNPSPTVCDPKQTSLLDAIQQDRLKIQNNHLQRAAFDNLDDVIRRKLRESGK